jgi:hypothetical protein
MLALVLNALLAADPALLQALEAQVELPGARLQVVDWSAPHCRGEYLPARVEGSGRIPVRVRGPRCDEWGWATVRLQVVVPVLTRSVRSGEALDGAWTTQLVEVHRGRTFLSSVPAGATATRLLRGGEPLSPEGVRAGPPPGTVVTVRVELGGITVEEPGTLVACAGDAICAVLPSGRRVAGRLEGEALVVSAGGGRL